MGVTKTGKYTEGQSQLSNIFKVLGHPARLAIIQVIIDRHSCICKDIVEEIGLAQPTISQHLSELKSIGLLKGSIKGKSQCYCIDEEAWSNIQTQFNAFFDQDVKTIC